MLMEKYHETVSKDPLCSPAKYFFTLSDYGLLKGFQWEQTMLEDEPLVEFNLDLARKST